MFSSIHPCGLGLLLKKAAAAIQKYGVMLVVANILSTRYTDITLVSPAGPNHVDDEIDTGKTILDFKGGAAADLAGGALGTDEHTLEVYLSASSVVKVRRRTLSVAQDAADAGHDIEEQLVAAVVQSHAKHARHF